jgi:hypothetical protein
VYRVFTGSNEHSYTIKSADMAILVQLVSHVHITGRPIRAVLHTHTASRHRPVLLYTRCHTVMRRTRNGTVLVQGLSYIDT